MVGRVDTNHARLLFMRKYLRAKSQVGVRALGHLTHYRCATASDFHRCFPLCVEHPGSYTPKT